MTLLLNITKRLFSIVMLLSVTLSVFSCGDDLKNVKYHPDNNNISFPSESETHLLPIESNEFNVKIVRGIANNAVTTDIQIDDTSGIFTLSSPTVSFAAGSFEATIAVKYTPSKLAFGKSYPFKISFNEKDMALTGINKTTVNAMLKLEYEEYGTISCARGSFFGFMPAEKRNFKLLLAKHTTNCYKIENLYNGGTNIEFVINNGGVTIFVPGYSYYANDDEVAGYPFHKIATGISHPTYGIVTAWLASETKKVYCTGLGADDKLILNSIMFIDTYYTVKQGYFGWFAGNRSDALKVTAVK